MRGGARRRRAARVSLGRVFTARLRCLREGRVHFAVEWWNGGCRWCIGVLGVGSSSSVHVQCWQWRQLLVQQRCVRPENLVAAGAAATACPPGLGLTDTACCIGQMVQNWLRMSKACPCVGVLVDGVVERVQPHVLCCICWAPCGCSYQGTLCDDGQWSHITGQKVGDT